MKPVTYSKRSQGTLNCQFGSGVLPLIWPMFSHRMSVVTLSIPVSLGGRMTDSGVKANPYRRLEEGSRGSIPLPCSRP